MAGGVQKPLRDGVSMAEATKPAKLRDPDQDAAIAMRRNGTVSAGAGSGKTTVLAARYIDLIASSGAGIPSILTLTFTRKAAAEMYSRIHASLVASDVPAVRDQAAHFTEASISTIDAFCGTVTRSSAARYGYAPDFATDDEKAREIAVDEALSYLLSNRGDPHLAELTARMGFATAWKGLFADLAYSFVSPCPDEAGYFAAIAEKNGRALDAIVEETLAEYRELARTVATAAATIAGPNADCARAIAFFGSLSQKLDALDGTSCGAAGDAATAEASGEAGTPAPAPKTRADEDRVRIVSDIAGEAAALRLVAFARKDPGQIAVKEAAKRARELADTLETASAFLADLGLLEAVMRHMDLFAERYRAAKRRAGVMGFRDVALCATHLLRTRRDIRLWWKNRYRYIMIDEFQDNNAEQKNLLFLLAERPDLSSRGIPRADELVPDKLFFVGDEKQSIYMFRDADVSVFRLLDRELADSGESPCQASLATNYRSEPGLVDFFNSAFARIMANPTEDFEARFAGIRSRSPTPGLAPTIRYLLREKPAAGVKDPEERSEDEILAHGVARFIRERVRGRDLPVPDGSGGTRPAGFGDFAVLMRSTSNQHLVERFFRVFDIPYSASALCGLFMESPVNDMYNALRLILFPEDRTALAAVLRSPLVRVSDDALVAILSSGAGLDFDPRSLPDADRDRFLRGKAMFASLAALADRVPAHELVARIWNECGLRAGILARPEAHPYLEHFEFIFDLARKAQEEGKNLSAFVADDLEPFMGAIEKKDVDELQRDHVPGVRIMTIHKSKGLEFPVVVIPWMNNQGQSESAGEAWYASDRVGVSLNLKPYDRPKASFRNIFFEEAKLGAAARHAAEIKRLFYVACTRAISHLVFAGFESSRADARGMSFHGLLCGGDGRKGADGRFLALESSVRLHAIPALSTEDYLALFRGSTTRRIDEFAASYRQAQPRDRRYGPVSLNVTQLESALGEMNRTSRGFSGAFESGAAVDSEGPFRTAIYACPQMPFTRLAHESDRTADEESGDGSDFGRICHAVLEARYKGLEDFSLLKEGIFGTMGAARLEGMKTAAVELAARFVDSDLGREIAGCPRVETEKDFMLALPGGRLAKGRMDIFAQEGDRILIVDFKTHRTASPGAYALQLWLYRRAAELLYPDSCVETWLVWLRGPVATRSEAGFADEDIAAIVEHASTGIERGENRTGGEPAWRDG